MEWEQGVRMRNGRAVALLDSTNGLFKSGFHVFIPLLGYVLCKDVLLRVDETTLQTLVTKDGRDATLSIGVRWSIRDLRALITKVKDPEENVIDVVRGAVGDVVPTLTFDQLPTDLSPAVVKAAKPKLHGWGIAVHDVYVVNLTAAQTLRIISDGGSAPSFHLGAA